MGSAVSMVIVLILIIFMISYFKLIGKKQMNYKSTLIYLIISTLSFNIKAGLDNIISITRVRIDKYHFETNLILGLSLSLLSILFGNKINLLIKNLGLSLIFTYIFYVINNVALFGFILEYF